MYQDDSLQVLPAGGWLTNRITSPRIMESGSPQVESAYRCGFERSQNSSVVITPKSCTAGTFTAGRGSTYSETPWFRSNCTPCPVLVVASAPEEPSRPMLMPASCAGLSDAQKRVCQLEVVKSLSPSIVPK